MLNYRLLIQPLLPVSYGQNDNPTKPQIHTGLWHPAPRANNALLRFLLTTSRITVIIGPLADQLVTVPTRFGCSAAIRTPRQKVWGPHSVGTGPMRLTFFG